MLEYLFKPLTREMVTQHFGPIVARQGGSSRVLSGGRVVTVTGVHGGVGATTIAANLAWYLAERARRHTLLLDGDLYGGTAATLLSVKPRPGLRVALEHPERVDELFIERTAQLVGERLYVLAGEGKLADPPPGESGALSRVLQVLRRRYKFLICDAPYLAGTIGREMLQAAHQRILVTECTVAGARDVLRYLALPEPAGAAAPLVVLNMTGLPGSIAVSQFAEATGRTPDLAIPYIKRVLRDAANLGDPAVTRHKQFARCMQALALRAAAVSGGDETLSRQFWRRA